MTMIDSSLPSITRRNVVKLLAMAGAVRGEAFAADPAAIGQNGAPALLGVAIQKAVLAFAPDFRRLILAFHVFV